ncbi:MAG: single-stranded DNA-binding protein [Elusimicrobia bacterium]|nr:single-stranded DNA-binding protein [Elusimicrobiota bacterium]
MEKDEAEPGVSTAGEGADLPYENDVMLTGRCGNAPKVTKTEKGHLRAAFSLTVTRGKERTFVNVVAWDALAESCGRLAKNAPLHVEGRLRSWKDDEGKKFQLQVVANVVQPLKDPQTKGVASRQGELAGV